MSELIDETPNVRMPACNGRGFMHPEVTTIHDMRQKQLPILPAILTILVLKDKLYDPFHCRPQTLLKNYLFTLSYTRTSSTKWEKRSLVPWQWQKGWH